MDKHFPLSKPPERILVISMRHIGDVLLTTPLIRSLQQAYPDAQIDVMVYERTAAILEGNPDIAQIITVPLKPNAVEYINIVRHIFRRYSLAVVTQAGDRPLIYALFASAQRIGLVPDRQTKAWWKRYFLQGWTEFDDVNTHTVIQFLRLMDVIEQPKHYALTTPEKTIAKSLPFKKYAILHLYPLWKYKRWHLKGWLSIADFLLEQGVNIVLTGSPAKDEVEYVNSLHQKLPDQVVNLAGKTSLSQLTELISNALLFIGPDTGVTHLASATGTPTIAIFGPTNPVKWAPWPLGYASDKNPFARTGNQQVNNIYLIQGQGDCVPCYLEGCDRHRGSHSRCLDELPASDIKNAVSKILVNELTCVKKVYSAK